MPHPFVVARRTVLRRQSATSLKEDAGAFMLASCSPPTPCGSGSPRQSSGVELLRAGAESAVSTTTALSLGPTHGCGESTTARTTPESLTFSLARSRTVRDRSCQCEISHWAGVLRGRNDKVIGRNDKVTGRNDKVIGRNDKERQGHKEERQISHEPDHDLARSCQCEISCEISQD